MSGEGRAWLGCAVRAVPARELAGALGAPLFTVGASVGGAEGMCTTRADVGVKDGSRVEGRSGVDLCCPFSGCMGVLSPTGLSCLACAGWAAVLVGTAFLDHACSGTLGLGVLGADVRARFHPLDAARWVLWDVAEDLLCPSDPLDDSRGSFLEAAREVAVAWPRQ